MIPETDERKRIMAEKTNVEAENEFASIKAAKLKGVDGDKLIVVDFRNAVNPHMACGPIANCIVETVLNDEKTDKKIYCTMAEVDCTPTFYMTTEPIFEKMVKHDEEDDDNAKPFYETINNNCFVDAMDYYDAYERRRCKWFKLFNFTEVINE